MKKPLVVIITGLVLAAAAYAGLFLVRTASPHAQAASELLWLKHEFSLTDLEFARIRELHERYVPDCTTMCARIAAANGELERLVCEPRNARRTRSALPGRNAEAHFALEYEEHARSLEN
jgi:hypothetical protein